MIYRIFILIGLFVTVIGTPNDIRTMLEQRLNMKTHGPS